VADLPRTRGSFGSAQAAVFSGIRKSMIESLTTGRGKFILGSLIIYEEQMKILVLCHDFPSPYFSDTLPVFHTIKNLSISFQHKITLLSFISGEDRFYPDLERYCNVDAVLKVNRDMSFIDQLLLTVKNTIDIRNIIIKLRSNNSLVSLLDYYYDPYMAMKVSQVLAREKPDILYLTRPMANYVQNIDIPKIIQPYDAVHEWHRQRYQHTNNYKKILYLLTYLMTRHYEKNVYPKFDACLVVTNEDKRLLNLLSPRINTVVIPNGVDIEYFKPINIKEVFPSIIYLSEMSGSMPVTNILYFVNQIFPYIKKEFPRITLYLVGRNPVKEVVNLAKDKSIIVTGYVDDVREYLAKSSIFIAPMIMGTGIKNKVLEAMSMGKCVVTTSVGAQGINGVHEKDLIISDNPEEFSAWIIKLLKDRSLRNSLGNNARELIEKEYTWEKIACSFDQLLRDIIIKQR